MFEIDGLHIIMGKTHIEKLGQGQAADFRKNNLGFIFQEYFLLDSLTVRENIAVPLTLLHKPAKEIDKKVKELAELFGIDSQLKKYPSELSGGQRQRVAAARAMVKRPPLSMKSLFPGQGKRQRACPPAQGKICHGR